MDAVIEGPNFEFSTESHEVRPSCFCCVIKPRALLQIMCKWHHAEELVLSRFCTRVSPLFCYLILHLSVTDNVACVVGLGLDGSYSS